MDLRSYSSYELIIQIRTDLLNELVEELILKTKEYLQPNPASRAKLMVSSKLRGQGTKSHAYTQPEGTLGEAMIKYAKDLGEDHLFARDLSKDTEELNSLKLQAKSDFHQFAWIMINESCTPTPHSMRTLEEHELMEFLAALKKVDSRSPKSRSLEEMGESLKQMSEIKYALEDNVKQNFLEPLHHLQSRDLKDVMHHRKKLQGRRLDYDCKKRRQTKGHVAGTHVGDEEIRLAEDKFEESFNLASMGMFNLLENDVEQISQLTALAEALQDYHHQCGEILQVLVERLQEYKEEATARPKDEYQPKKLQDLNIFPEHEGEQPAENFNGAPPPLTTVQGNPSFAEEQRQRFARMVAIFLEMVRLKKKKKRESPPRPPSPNFSFYTLVASPARSPAGVNPPQYLGGLTTGPARSPNGTNIPSNPTTSPLPSPVRSPARTPVRQTPCCQALYDFEAENEGEIAFKEGDVINLLNKVDENWFEGSVHGRTGLFPVNYVQVMVPLP
ncbi:SH3GL1 [Cordylochernes scorpioides]|uniref:Endophilin-A n=1 Tax=Cordylochernes scorpioides TaxID=51811 RepID=A0ABY6KSH5_9ARAC|nr:SH3GL1 [Cordylochernes scorpioides]